MKERVRHLRQRGQPENPYKAMLYFSVLMLATGVLGSIDGCLRKAKAGGGPKDVETIQTDLIEETDLYSEQKGDIWNGIPLGEKHFNLDGKAITAHNRRSTGSGMEYKPVYSMYNFNDPLFNYRTRMWECIGFLYPDYEDHCEFCETEMPRMIKFVAPTKRNFPRTYAQHREYLFDNSVDLPNLP